MLKNHISLLLYLLLPLLVGCAQALSYVPNRPPVPLLKHKDEVNVSGGLHFPFSPGLDIQAAFADDKHWSLYGALQADGGYGPEGWSNQPMKYNTTFYEVGIGHFDSVTSSLHQETFLLCGFGSGSSSHFGQYNPYTTDQFDTSQLSTFRFAIQGNIGFEGSVGAIGIGLATGFEHFFNVRSSGTMFKVTDILGQTPPATPFSFSRPTSDLYVEPILFWRIGYKYVKIMQEIWFELQSNHSVGAFVGSANESLTLSLDF